MSLYKFKVVCVFTHKAIKMYTAVNSKTKIACLFLDLW